jgi:hypothetical protein
MNSPQKEKPEDSEAKIKKELLALKEVKKKDSDKLKQSEAKSEGKIEEKE